MKCICGNCEKVWDEKNLVPLWRCSDLGERLTPGSVTPAGECPECGAFCYPKTPPHDEEEV